MKKVIMHILAVQRRISLNILFLAALTALLPTGTTFAEDVKKQYINDRYSLGIIAGHTYDPGDDINFYMLSGSVMYDYEKIWRHRAPEQLRFKLEYDIGGARERESRFITSFNIFALYYINPLDDVAIRPYLEGGIGIIYTGFQVQGQGLKINFNPQMGIGTEFTGGSGDSYFLSLRLHHISNGGLYRDNRGVNSVTLTLGRIF